VPTQSLAEAGLFLLDPDVVLKKMKMYSNLGLEDELPSHKELFYQTPKTIRHSLQLSKALGMKIGPILSSPTRRHMQSYRKAREQILRMADLQQGDLVQIQTATKESRR
jgi:hypothetical protein